MVTAVIESNNIYTLMNRIATEAGALAPEGKPGVPFPFRGVDQVVGHVAPLLRKYGVVVIPTVLEHEVSSAPSGNKVVTTTKILTRFTFYAPDGTSVEATTAGLANDYSDRSTAQAQSVAFRVALLQSFALPTHSPEPEQTGVEREAPVQQTHVTPDPAKQRESEVQKGRAAIKKLAAEKNIDYLETATNMKLPAGWGDDVSQLSTLFKALQEA